MADIPGDTGEGLDIRYLTSGTTGDVVGIFPSGLFAGSFALTNIGSVSIHSSNLIGVSGDIFTGGSIKISAPTDHFIQRIDYSGALNVPIYIGLAAPGTAVDSAGWQLKELSYHTNSMISGILFGSGNTNFDKIWNDRADTNKEYS